jgi:retinol dehydrogenase 12
MRDMVGKVCLITGASSGIGRVTARVLAARGAKVLLACRDASKSRAVLDDISKVSGAAELLPLDLSDLDSVRSCAAAVLSRPEPLDVLLNNAGVAGKSGLTRQGFELTFGVNHLGHFLLTQLLLPKLLAAPHSRVVNVSSKAHYNASGIDFGSLREPPSVLRVLHAYNVSKLANVLHAKSLARRYGDRGLHAYSLHPGVIASDVWREVPQPLRWLMQLRMISNEDGAKTSLYCATSAAVAADNGSYYDECQEKRPSDAALSRELADELWERSEQYVAP